MRVMPCILYQFKHKQRYFDEEPCQNEFSRTPLHLSRKVKYTGKKNPIWQFFSVTCSKFSYFVVTLMCYIISHKLNFNNTCQG